ncbi:endo-1,4-beta-xylanase [Ranunculus cassubicifolius]
MKVGGGIHLVLLLCFILYTVVAIKALPYDHSASIECLAEPLKPQYRGGIIVNSEFNHGLKGWSVFGKGKIEKRISNEGNSFIVAHSRNNKYDSFSQKLHMKAGNHYTFSAWIQVSKGSSHVSAVLKTQSGYKTVGTVAAESGCWSMLKAGFSVNASGPAELYFQSENTGVEIWVDSVSLQPFTKEEWRSHQDQNVQKARKSVVKIQAKTPQGETLAGAKISIKQTQAGFPFGTAINKTIVDNTAYQNWLTSRFTVATFANEMKWYSTEYIQGKEDYSASDAMLNFAKQHGISIRGHNIFWDDPTYQPSWAKSVPPYQLREGVERRVNSVVKRYAGQLIAWDVVNENLHFSFFEDKFGKNFTALMFQKTHMIDPQTTLFMNDYNTLEESRDDKSFPAVYLQKLREIQSVQEKNTQLAIGCEGHFSSTPNIPYMRSSLDTLAAAGVPIWITELDLENSPNQAQHLEELLREAHSHPAVKGVVLWTASYPNECNKMCLTDNNFRNLPTGDVVDKLLHEWTQKNVVGVTDDNGFFETSLFHGEYEVTIHHSAESSSSPQNFKVEPTEATQEHKIYVQL